MHQNIILLHNLLDSIEHMIIAYRRELEDLPTRERFLMQQCTVLSNKVTIFQTELNPDTGSSAILAKQMLDQIDQMALDLNKLAKTTALHNKQDMRHLLQTKRSIEEKILKAQSLYEKYNKQIQQDDTQLMMDIRRNGKSLNRKMGAVNATYKHAITCMTNGLMQEMLNDTFQLVELATQNQGLTNLRNKLSHLAEDIQYNRR